MACHAAPAYSRPEPGPEAQCGVSQHYLCALSKGLGEMLAVQVISHEHNSLSLSIGHWKHVNQSCKGYLFAQRHEFYQTSYKHPFMFRKVALLKYLSFLALSGVLYFFKSVFKMRVVSPNQMKGCRSL